MFLGNKGIFPPVCYVFIAAFVTEFICVCFPIICSLREKRQQKQLLEQAYGNNTSAEANDRPSLTCNNRYSNAEKALSRQSFQALLNGKTTFELFKAFTVRDLSVENVHFYDACRKILNYVGNSPVLPEEQQLLAAYQIGLERRLAWLRDTFLLESSDYQINLPHIQQRDLLQMIDGDISDFNLRVLQAAQHEIETLMFFDTYLRYLSSQSALELSNTLTSENNETRRKGQSKFASLIMPIRSLL
ncbi:hypothetical protein BDF19DRAFT_415603 [Syncephalis fuscata]|nr:hypothetical protein BDF19DRAFT_415603 [Syncephalis fuscata]